MITKDQYCWVIIKKFKLENPQYENVATKDLVRYIYQSTNLGIALQHLGYIKPNSNEAAFLNDKYKDLIDEGRVDEVPEEEKVQILTTREILDMLPDTLEE